ncbi:MAG: CvpA family protein, partial [Planctomycetota bacterium]
MVILVIVLIVSGCAAFQYLKGTFVRAFATFIVTIFAGIIAFSFFEVLAALFIGGRDSSFKFIPPPWMQTLIFLLLFLFSFALLQTLAQYLTRQEVNLGLWPERIGRLVCGILSGLVLSSFIITTAAMAPLPNNYPYQRFDPRRPDAWRPNKILFNTDALASGLFGTISNGSLSGKRSFATLHPAFLDQLFLNRHSIANDVLPITREQAITVPRKNAAWHAPEDIKDSQGNTIPPLTGYSLMLVRVGLRKSAVTEAGKFT